MPGETPADRVLASALEELGCVVLRKRAPGVPGFAAEYGGLRLTAWDEEGRTVDSGALLTLVSRIELDRGGGRVAGPAGAPAAVAARGAGRPAAVLRLDRDGPEAEELYAALPWLRDGVFAACRICARLGQTGERLRTLVGRVPRFVRLQREVPRRRGRGEVMQSLAETGGDARGEGVRIRSGEAWIWMAPLSRALRPAGSGRGGGHGDGGGTVRFLCEAGPGAGPAGSGGRETAIKFLYTFPVPCGILE